VAIENLNRAGAFEERASDLSGGPRFEFRDTSFHAQVAMGVLMLFESLST
jgi:hypothetical protein